MSDNMFRKFGKWAKKEESIGQTNLEVLGMKAMLGGMVVAYMGAIAAQVCDQVYPKHVASAPVVIEQPARPSVVHSPSFSAKPK